MNLGKCLLFYLGYYPEMARLYEQDEPNVDGLPDADRVLAKVRLVGEVANREAAAFLEECGTQVENCLRQISAIERIRNNVEATWSLKYSVCPKKATEKQFEVGVSLGADQVAVIPWVWCPGGRRAADQVIGILGKGTSAIAWGWDRGTVVLNEIKIPIPDQFDVPVSGDSLVEQVAQTFAALTAKDIKAIDRVASTRGKV